MLAQFPSGPAALCVFIRWQCKKKKNGQYVFTDCTEDNVQNTHVYYKDIVSNTHYRPYVHIYIMYTSIHSNM